MISKISKIGIELSRLYEDYVEEKHEYLNHKRIIEYLFNKPFEITQTMNYESSIRLVRLELNDATFVSCKFDTMNGILIKYSEKHNKYMKYIKSYQKNSNKKILNIDYLPSIHDMSHEDRRIMEILDSIENKVPKKFRYTYKWNFLVEGNDNNIIKLPTMNYRQSFSYDFYGVTMWHNQLVQFVILFDNTSKISEIDIEKQYILYQMNIHLLRLNRKSNFKKDIISFIRKIRNTTEYIIQGVLVKNILQPDNIFEEDYEYNHKIYLKIQPKKHPKYDSDDDEFFEYLSIKDNNTEIDQEPGIPVTDEFFQKLLEDKKDLHPPRKKTMNEQKAEKIIVDLIKKRK